MQIYLLIAAATSGVLILIAAIARVPTYHFAPIFLLPPLWAGFLFRRFLVLTPFHYLLFALFLVLHGLGAFGFYQNSPLPFSFDIAVHSYFGLLATLVLMRILGHYLPLRPWQVYVGALMLVMGTGAIHEIMEYVSYLLLGEQRGMLKPSSSYFFDTQRDLLSNLMGALAAIAVAALFRVRTSRRACGPHDARIESDNASAPGPHGTGTGAQMRPGGTSSAS